MQKNEQWYKWSVWNTAAKKGFEIYKAEAPQWQSETKHYLIVWDGVAYIPNELANLVLGSSAKNWFTRAMKIGRRRMYGLTEEVVEHMIDHNDYERRNDRERDIQARNCEIIEALIDLM